MNDKAWMTWHHGDEFSKSQLKCRLFDICLVEIEFNSVSTKMSLSNVIKAQMRNRLCLNYILESDRDILNGDPVIEKIFNPSVHVCVCNFHIPRFLVAIALTPWQSVLSSVLHSESNKMSPFP